MRDKDKWDGTEGTSYVGIIVILTLHLSLSYTGWMISILLGIAILTDCINLLTYRSDLNLLIFSFIRFISLRINGRLKLQPLSDRLYFQLDSRYRYGRINGNLTSTICIDQYETWVNFICRDYHESIFLFHVNLLVLFTLQTLIP